MNLLKGIFDNGGETGLMDLDFRDGGRSFEFVLEDEVLANSFALDMVVLADRVRVLDFLCRVRAGKKKKH